MLQIYDRVLGSRSEATLVALSVLVTFLFIAMGLLDNARSRIMARIGARIQGRLDRRVFSAALSYLTQSPNDPVALAAQRDLEAVQRLWALPVLLAVFDIPWIPAFICAIFVFHRDLGFLAMAGGLVLVTLSFLNQRMTKAPLAKASNQSMTAERISDLIKAESETDLALGMKSASFDRWQAARNDANDAAIEAGDRADVFGNMSKSFRMFFNLQCLVWALVLCCGGNFRLAQ